MAQERLRLRKLAEPDVWLATWTLEEPVWAVVMGRRTPSAMLAEVVSHAREIPWRSDPLSRVEVGRAVLALRRARDESDNL